MCATGCSWIRALRNLELGAAGIPFAPQFEILASRAVHRAGRGRTFFRWRPTLVECARFREIRLVHRKWRLAARADRVRDTATSARRRAISGLAPARGNLPRWRGKKVWREAAGADR